MPPAIIRTGQRVPQPAHNPRHQFAQGEAAAVSGLNNIHNRTNSAGGA